MICFVSECKPFSIQSDGCKNYKKRLQNEFASIRSLYTELPIKSSVYSKIVYIHSVPTDIDVDNMSKPFVDAFNGVIYSDDRVINHRVCSKVKFDDMGSIEINIGMLPTAIANKLEELIERKNPHIVYFEIGPFTPDMVSIGGGNNETGT